jgi:pimeloyl-ACP methyl ester carboxylesterase
VENPRRRKHSALFYRNSFIAATTQLLTFCAIILSRTWLSLIWLIPLVWLNYLIWIAYRSVHPRRRSMPGLTPADFDLEYQEITLHSRDGLQLAAWYVPGRNHTAIILVHGSGGEKATMLNHARMLAKDGYGLLMLDLRAHGNSEGDTISGLYEANDVLGAVDYLQSRPDINPDYIGALGVSFGATAVLQAASQERSIRSVVLDSIGPACLDDHGGRPATLRRWINYPVNWFMYALGDFMAGVKMKEGVLAGLQRLAGRPVMLIAAGRGKEIAFNRLFFKTAYEPKSLWEVPRAEHATAIIFERETYHEKVRAFFQGSFLPDSGLT